MHQSQSTWRFPRAFWTANSVELCERAAYYGTFIALRTYLLRVVHLGDVQAGFVAGFFGALLYLFPFFTGAIADRMGFRQGLLLAFALLTLGYTGLGMFSTLGPVLVSLLAIVIGGAFVKPIISGTVAKSSSEVNRARAFSIFYMVVNIGSFTGKAIVAPIRIQMDVSKVPYFSAVASFVALLVVLFVYWPREDHAARPRSLRETLQGMATALSNMRFLALILITAGFWAIQGQLYASMPDYVIRMAGEAYKPEWYANVNSVVVVCGVVAITHLVRHWRAETAIGVAMVLGPVSALAMASSKLFQGPLHILGLAVHPITAMMVLGIALQGLAECFLSPKYLEYASKQAPPGREGLYLGYAHLNTFFAWLFGFIFAGYMLRKFCPDPGSLPPAVQQQHALALQGQAPMPAAYANAHYLWYAFAIVGAVSFVMLLLYMVVTRRRPAPAAAPAA
jgi:dipeptide/tripeptide permease